MNVLVHSNEPVTLVGGGPITQAQLDRATALAPVIIGADGGGMQAAALGARVSHVIGDMDSGSPIEGAKTHIISEQQTTDLDKCLYATDAPYYLGVGFTGGLIDHHLAACHSLIKTDKRLILLGSEDICFRAPPNFQLELPVGTRFSLFPMGAVSGTSKGLKWTIDGLNFAPDVTIGTSNETNAKTVDLTFAEPCMLIILPDTYLETVVAQMFA